MSATVDVVYTVPGISGDDHALRYVIGSAWEAMEPPNGAAGRRTITNHGPDAIDIAPHPSRPRSHPVAAGETISYDRPGVLFVATR